MNIKYAVFDLDGVLSKGKQFSKDFSTDILCGERENLDQCRIFLDQKGVIPIVVTGRSLKITEPIIDYCMNGHSVCEHGTMIVDKEEGRTYHLIDREQKFKDLIKAKEHLEKFISCANKFDEILRQRFPKEKIDRKQDNLHILTYEFKSPKGKKFAKELYQYIHDKFFPKQIKEDLKKKHLLLKTCDMAFDIMPGVSKKEGLRHILTKLGINPEHVIIAGDSFHSDGEMMQAVENGVWICPANSDSRMKLTIEARGEKGYVSTKPYFEGTMEGLKYFLGN